MVKGCLAFTNLTMNLRAFILDNLTLAPAPAVPEIRLYRAHPASGLSRLDKGDAAAPYWAYGWAGGTVLARHVLDHPETVAGRRVLDLGCGSGLVAIAAARAGARHVTATDLDPHALAATQINAEANDVTVEVASDVATSPDVDIVLAGDVFYTDDVAARSLAFLDACAAAGIHVLVGDPGRTFLPFDRLERIAEYAVPDFGQGEPAKAWVFAFGDQGAPFA